MTKQLGTLIVQLKGLGFTRGSRMKLYDESFEMTCKPIVVKEDLVLVDAIEKKSGQMRRVRIPLPILKMVTDRVA